MASHWGDDLTEEEFVFDHVTSDPFGIPSNIMGRQDEAFYSMLGRIVATAAILEYKVLVFYQYLVGRRQDVFTELSIARLIAAAQKSCTCWTPHRIVSLQRSSCRRRGQLARRGTPTSRTCGQLRVVDVTFGWRMPPKKNAKEPTITEGTLDEMRDDLRRLTALLEVNYLNRVLALVSGGQHLNSPDS